MEHKLNSSIQLLYLYLCGKEEFRPQYEPVAGFARTIKQENPKFIYKTIGILPPSTKETGMSPDQFLDALTGEFAIDFIQF